MSIEQTQGWGWQPVLHPDDLNTCIAVWTESVRTGESYEVEYRFKRASDGMYRWHLGRATPQCDDAGEIVKWFGTCTDIHDQKQSQQQLLRLHEELEARVQERATALLQANSAQQNLLRKLEHSNSELQQFASIASHDLQEPLRKIQAFGDRLKTKCGPDLSEEGRDYIERMQNSSGRMRVLIDDLLEFARVSSKAAHLQAVDLKAVVAEVLVDLEESLHQSGGQIKVETLPQVQADPRQMQQLFQNLISNALKFRRAGVLPEVRIYEEAIPDDSQKSASLCRIVIADNGIGFDEQYADRIFGAFQRLHGRQEYSGTGIGLAICRKIVQQHGGEITVRSTPGAGASFLFDLPRAEETQSLSENLSEIL